MAFAAQTDDDGSGGGAASSVCSFEGAGANAKLTLALPVEYSCGVAVATKAAEGVAEWFKC